MMNMITYAPNNSMQRLRLLQALLLLAFIFCLCGCKKPEQYYEKLQAYPEILQTYEAVYGVGDTITIEGRLNPQSDLNIQIGGVDAKISVFSNSFVGDKVKIDKVKIQITKEMGIGSNRPISISSGGSTIQCPAIEIIEDSNSGYLTGPLIWQRHASVTSKSVPLFCLNGKGTVFLWNANNTLSRIAKDGTTTTAYNGSTFTDAFGAFTITVFNAGGVDPQEKTCYFSALTSDASADNSTNEIYRLCKIDLQTGILTTLNRTLYPKTDNKRTLASAMPFEGNINTVKIYQATGIYPDSKGNVYVQLSLHAMTKLSSNGDFKYLINYSNNYDRLTPRIWNETTNFYYADNEVFKLLPGIKTRELMRTVLAVSPDEGLLYGKIGTATVGVSLFDLNNQTEIYSNAFKYWNPVNSDHIPYLSGSFGILTLPQQLGNLALPGQKLLNLYNGAAIAKLPVLGLLNFAGKKGERYAPGLVKDGGFAITNFTDLFLNYDEEGLIYSTANSKTVIIKTKYQ